MSKGSTGHSAYRRPPDISLDPRASMFTVASGNGVCLPLEDNRLTRVKANDSYNRLEACVIVYAQIYFQALSVLRWRGIHEPFQEDGRMR